MLKTRETISNDWRENTAQGLATLTFVLAAYGLASVAVDVVRFVI
jgi:hypothetical protein